MRRDNFAAGAGHGARLATIRGEPAKERRERPSALPGSPARPDRRGGTLRGLWRFIVVVGLLEYKSVVWPLQHGDLGRLIAYGLPWRAARQSRDALPDGTRTERLAAHEVTLALAVPSLTPTLHDELDDLGLVLPPSGTGYHSVTGALLPLVIVDLGTVAEREDDDLLRWFAGRPLRTLEGRLWVDHHQNRKGPAMSTQATPDLFGYEEYVARMMQEFTPEQRLAGLPPEQIARALTPEQLLFTLPDEALRALSDDYVASLPTKVQAKVRARRER